MPTTPINRSQFRSVVISTGGLVASEHPLASQAGAAVLAAGGHAVDAAIAANAMMGVVCPMMCGIGGDLFAIVSEENGALHGVNASGWAPARLTRSHLGGQGIDAMPEKGPHSVTVPGAVGGWSLLLDRFGRLPFATLLEPAIELAREGFPVAEITAEEWRNAAALLAGDRETSRVFLPQAEPPAVGAIFRNPDLAWSYEQIAAQGADGYYRGEIARRICDGLGRRGGVMAAADLAEYRADWVEPVSTNYRGWDVFELPPNGAGIAALMMLNIMETFPIRDAGHNTVETLHTLIEAKKLAYADMRRHVADPRFGDVPVATLVSKSFARERAARIDRERAGSSVAAGQFPVHAGDTTYLAAVDRRGNMVSLIQSNYHSFGSGLVAEGTGFPLQNRGSLFTLDPDHPNVLAPRKRPLHTIIPAFMTHGDTGTRIAFGIMGGWNQSQAHAQFVSNVVDHGMNIQAALEAPRFTKLTFDGADVHVEARVAPAIVEGLGARGHHVDMVGDLCSFMGGGQAVMRRNGVNYGASDPRKDGCALPEAVRRHG